MTTHSIRTKVLTYIITTVSLALLGIHTNDLFQNYRELQRELDQRLSIYLESTSGTIAGLMWELDTPSIRNIVDGFAKDPDFTYVEVVDSQGRLIAQSMGIHSREQVSSKRAPLILKDRDIHVGQVYLELSQARLLAKQEALMIEGILLILVTLVIVIAVIIFSFRRITQPLDELTGVMKYLAEDKLTIPIPYLDRKDEIGQISKAVEVFKHYAVDRQALMAKQIEHEKMLTHQAHHDSLTDLPNRFLAMDRLTQLIYKADRSSEQVALMFVDLDDFKKINDTLGHEVGDKLLIDAAKRMSIIVRNSDTVGRLGGDEFVVVLGDLNQLNSVQMVAEKINHALAEPFVVDHHELVISSSIGIVVFPEDGGDPSELLRKADSAMYHAKAQGGNTYAFFTEEMNQAVSRRLAIEQAMRGAIERHEFEVFYQPLVEVKTDRIIGTEALLRWQNSELGNVTPDEFIPVAEQSKMIIELGDFVLDDALQKTARWTKLSGRRLRASVNISPRQFRDPDIFSKIELNLAKSGVRPEDLTLELTEGVLLNGDSQILSIMNAISDLGVAIAMDDFGTGYSSLSYLRRFPFDIVKVDRSFVNDITEDTADAELVHAAIAMAHGLNLNVVAEGVETKEQLSMLYDMGCDTGQGYFFGKPMPATELEKRLIETQQEASA